MSRTNIDDADLGPLVWGRDGRNDWQTDHCPFWAGHHIALQIDCDDNDDAEAVLARARRVVADLRRREPALRREAARKYLLDLYNKCWCDEEEGDRPLSIKEFLDLLDPQLVVIDSSGRVELWYCADDDDADVSLFGGHAVVVQLDHDGRYEGSHLVC